MSASSTPTGGIEVERGREVTVGPQTFRAALPLGNRDHAVVATTSVYGASVVASSRARLHTAVRSAWSLFISECTQTSTSRTPARQCT